MCSSFLRTFVLIINEHMSQKWDVLIIGKLIKHLPYLYYRHMPYKIER